MGVGLSQGAVPLSLPSLGRRGRRGRRGAVSLREREVSVRVGGGGEGGERETGGKGDGRLGFFLPS